MKQNQFEVLEEFRGDLGDICQEVIDLREKLEETQSELNEVEDTNGKLEGKIRDLEK